MSSARNFLAVKTGDDNRNLSWHFIGEVIVNILETVQNRAGLYTLSEAALFAGIRPQTLRYWHYGTRTSQPLREAQISKTEGKFLTFYEFVEALAIRSLRLQKKASLQKIRAAVQEASEKYNVDYLFAHRDHRTVLIGGEFHIFLEQDSPTGLTGKDRGQKSFQPCLESFMEDLKFDDKRMACEYVAYRYGNKSIRMNPSFHFGEPMVGDTGHTAETLYIAAVAEGSVDRVCEFYDVDRESVLAACRYWESLSSIELRN